MAAIHLIFPVLFSLCGAAIVPVEKSYTASVEDDVQLTWSYDDENQMFSVDWTFQSENSNSPESIMTQESGSSATAENNYNVEHGGNGKITLKSVTKESSGKYFCAVSYNLGTGLSPVTGTATLTVHATSSTPDVSSTSTSTTTPTTTPSATPTVTSSTSSSTSTTSSPVPTSTTSSPVPTSTTSTSTTTPSKTTSETSTITSLTTISSTTFTTIGSTADTTTPSSGNVSTVIILSSVVGGLLLVGIAITIILMLLSHRKKHLSVKHARNHRHHDWNRREKRPYPTFQEFGQYYNIYYEEYPGMGIKMNPLYVLNRSAHRAEQNCYLGYPPRDHQIDTRNHFIYYGGHNSNMRPQTNWHFYEPRYHGGSTLSRDDHNNVTADYEINW